jgi:hypothetical protein
LTLNEYIKVSKIVHIDNAGMIKQNCWEFKKCGREPGGAKVAELGVCPAAMESRTHGIHFGKGAGRACWAIAGTLCGGKVQGIFAAKLSDCLVCEFYKLVAREESFNFLSVKEIFTKCNS